MGKANPNANDTANMALTISGTATTRYPFSAPVRGSFNVSITGTFVATVGLSKSFDGGVTWAPISSSTLGTAISFTAPTTFEGEELEPGVLWGVDVTYTSGTVVVRLSN